MAQHINFLSQMTSQEVRQRFIDFFVKKYNHKQIASSSVVPDNDPTVLFTTAGMHPLVPYLMGEVHPAGKRLVDSQKCIRTDDIDEVGDATHCTFFEMLGNWSLGDYFKEEAIKMSYELLTSPIEEGGYGIAAERLMVTCFAGDSDAPRDDEAAEIWEKLGFRRAVQSIYGEKKLIFFYEKKKNWWGPAGQNGPCGPDTEIFYDTYPELPSNEHKPEASQSLIEKYQLPDGSGNCHPNCECGRYVEIWNNVFMQYNKLSDGTYEPLKQKNVDTGMGLERLTAIMQGVSTHYETDLFAPVKARLRELAGSDIESSEEKVISERIIADHLRAATFILGDKMGVAPSNTDQGYILRRLIRRAIRHGKKLGITHKFTADIAKVFIEIYGEIYSELRQNEQRILTELEKEETKFLNTLSQGEREFEKILRDLQAKGEKKIPTEAAFTLYDTHGFPIEMTQELAKEHGLEVDVKAFEERFKKHQELSRAGAEQKFAGGLADHSEESKKLHTATHLLHQALKTVLGAEVEQRGSNITQERLRFDFNYSQKMTPEQIKQVEDLVNLQIDRKLPVSFEIMTVEEAKKRGAIGLFEEKYGDQIKVYKMGDFSFEICGGPHVENTADLKRFKIAKEEASSAGIRRIKAVIGESAMK